MASVGKTVDEETVQRTMGDAPDPTPDAAQLTVVYPPGAGERMRLGGREVVIGRRPRSDEAGLSIDHPTASRRHFAIRWDEDRGEHVGRDLGSRNGSRVDGHRVHGDRTEGLADGSVLRLGDVLLVYERGPWVGTEDDEAVDHEAVFGRAARMVELRRRLAAAARDPSPILLVGETGTGKELVAREVHRLSGRRGPFVALNCAALSPQLVESQLFGHKKGAFTGADTAHDGYFRAADGGTLFLDEVGELPRELQPKLLRVLQEREVQPVGDPRPVKVDVRVVSATLRDLSAMTGEDRFRLDLYARLSPWELSVPALRDRRVDLLAFIGRLAARWQRERGHEVVPPVIEANAAERILLSDWPDNLRGLDRLVHRAAGDPGQPIDVAPPRLERPARRSVAEPGSEGGRAPKPSKEELERVLGDHDGSVRATAKHFGRDRRQIYRWMEQYGLRDQDEERSTRAAGRHAPGDDAIE